VFPGIERPQEEAGYCCKIVVNNSWKSIYIHIRIDGKGIVNLPENFINFCLRTGNTCVIPALAIRMNDFFFNLCF
jgi:hypothetical protein